MKKKAVFLDRDGVINVDKGYVYRIEDFEFYPGVFEALKLLQDSGYKLLVVTNQSGIALDYYKEEDFLRLNDYMISKLKENGIEIDKVYYCPHHEEGTNSKYTMKCDCRKPSSGMIRRGIEEFDIDVSRSFLVGDKENDIKAAHKEGIKAILVKTGQGVKYVKDTQADYVAENLLDAVKNIILKENSKVSVR
ncbi:MAG: D-glycero-beta-D-manno-heptose 1,7-bisphosphate 7-phosphatase [Aquificae bacterium]|nr:D-glycero-beta-D-manno-heptose 1,7-bisphosphate 7-phosphatase [Aquificota bacterium]